MSSLQQDHPDAYANALHLIQQGVPVFISPRAADFPDGGSSNCGYHFPSDWQHTEPDPDVLGRWSEGDALCAVMGHIVDGLDRDPRNGGDLPEYLTPVSYGRQTTPSGGTHDLIATLGVRSKDGVLPGVDLKAGVSGIGHGFIFLAPTEKRSKTDGQIHQYQWDQDPDLTPLLIADDDSGSGLLERVRSGRSADLVGPEYSGPVYQDLTPEQQAAADSHVDAILFDWSVRLGDASGWSEDQRDASGRGWEALARDAAWTVAKLAVCPWTGTDESEAEEIYARLLPELISQDPKCQGKWYNGLLEKAAAQPVSLPPWWADDFFESTQVLRHIRDAAHARLASPSGVLALVLGRCLAEVPPGVLLPPVVASAASLNLGIAIVAGSGGGKSSSINVSQEILGLVGMNQDPIEHGIGSGEGLVDLFLQPELALNAKGELKPTGQSVLADDPRALVVCDEIEQMEASGSGRSGSTLNPLLRDALTGDALMMSNARAGGRTRRVPKRSYRAVVVVGVQPGRSDVLLSDAQVDVGTPQRFLWCSALDTERPQTRPEWPGPLEWEPPARWPDEIDYPQHIQEEVISARERFLDGLCSPSEGHSVLTKLKVATAIAVLHGDTKITDQWWDLAGMLIGRSRDIQSECRKVLAETVEKRDINREIRRARATAEATEVVSVSRLRKAAEATIRRIRSAEDKISWSDAKPASRLREGLDTEEIIEEIRELAPEISIHQYDAQGRTAWKFSCDGS